MNAKKIKDGLVWTAKVCAALLVYENVVAPTAGKVIAKAKGSK